MTITHTSYEQAINAIRAITDFEPVIGLVLGSGLGPLADQIESPIFIPYEDIPNWPRSTVHGHSGRLVFGYLEGQPVVAQQGRAHFYEGYTMQEVTFPIRVMHLLGVKTLILTNAAGGVNKDYRVGDLMLLIDHLNFPGFAGMNPLMGPNDDTLGPRFLGMSKTYDRDLRHLAQRIAEEHQLPLHVGVYAALAGPTYETPAEIRLLRTLGADAVGMSTVHEVIVARHSGLRVMAISGITNECIDDPDTEVDTNHEEVLEAGLVLVPRLTTLLRGVLKGL